MLLTYKQLFEKKTIIPKIGDKIICLTNIDDLKTINHVGILRKGGIEFLHRFSNKLHNLDGKIHSNKGWYLTNKKFVKIFNDNRNKETIPLIYSDEFREVISYSLKFLLDYEDIYFSDVSFIDVTNRNETVSCLSAHNFYKLDKDEDPWTSTLRQNIRIGRLIRKITEIDIENSVNEYKFSYQLHKNNIGKFKIAKGIEMAKWYLEINYAQGGGSLNASCMKHVRSQRRLPIYIQNPDKIRMLYLLNPAGKLLGRALLWRLDFPHGIIFMDRIYTTEDYVEKLFLDYAKKKGMLTRDEVERKKIPLRVNLSKDYGDPRNNPFMDTFKFFKKGENYLTNRFDNFKADEYWEYVDHD